MCVPSFPSVSRRSLKPLRGSGSTCRFQIFPQEERPKRKRARTDETNRCEHSCEGAGAGSRSHFPGCDGEKKKTTFDRLGIPEASRLKTTVWFLHQHTSSGPFGHVWVIIPKIQITSCSLEVSESVVVIIQHWEYLDPEILQPGGTTNVRSRAPTTRRPQPRDDRRPQPNVSDIPDKIRQPFPSTNASLAKNSSNRCCISGGFQGIM